MKNRLFTFIKSEFVQSSLYLIRRRGFLPRFAAFCMWHSAHVQVWSQGQTRRNGPHRPGEHTLSVGGEWSTTTCQHSLFWIKKDQKLFFLEHINHLHEQKRVDFEYEFKLNFKLLILKISQNEISVSLLFPYISIMNFFDNET